MNKKLIKTLSILAIVIIPTIMIVSGYISFSNNDVVLKNRFKQKFSERTAFYDKMWKVLNQKGQIAVKNDSSFQHNIDVIMAGRKDAQGLFMKWVTESNPNANFNEVSEMYKDLSRAVESQREGFFEQEKYLQDIVREDDDLLATFPGTFWNFFAGKKHIEYKPITSDQTDEVIKTGKDNNTKLF